MATVAAARRLTFQNPAAWSGAAKYTAHVLPHLLAGCADRDGNVRQCSVYGLGVLAALRPQAFAPHLPARAARHPRHRRRPRRPVRAPA